MVADYESGAQTTFIANVCLVDDYVGSTLNKAVSVSAVPASTVVHNRDARQELRMSEPRRTLSIYLCIPHAGKQRFSLPFVLYHSFLRPRRRRVCGTDNVQYTLSGSLV